jgi:hypothetical protein
MDPLYQRVIYPFQVSLHHGHGTFAGLVQAPKASALSPIHLCAMAQRQLPVAGTIRKRSWFLI